jgi:hypothetical protein
MKTRKAMTAKAVRVPDELWARAMAKAANRDEYLSEVIRVFLEDDYLKRPSRAKAASKV